MIEYLEDLGFNTNEAKIYVALLELGEASAGKVSKQAQVNRTSTYDTLERLMEEGLVTYAIEANMKIFRALPPRVILEKMEKKREIANSILPQLTEIYETKERSVKSEIYQGRRGIKTILNEILKCKAYISFGSSGEFMKIMKHDFLIYQKEKKEKGIKSRIVLPMSAKNKDTHSKAHGTFRFIPDEFASPITTWVYDGKVAIVNWAELPVATVISGKKVAQSYNNYFELLWQQAEP